jgi:glycosyltransferase involved in cell wall biosynthesis
MMRVLLVTPEFPPISIGGGGVVYENLSKQLKLDGHQVTVIAGNFANKGLIGKVEIVPVNDFFVDFVPLLPFPRSSKYDGASYTLPTVRGTFHLIKEVIQSENKIIHLHGYCHPMINLTALSCVVFRKKYLLTCHGIPQAPENSGIAVKTLFKIYLQTVVKMMAKKAKAVTLVSNALMTECESKNLVNQKTIVIPNGINTALIKVKPEVSSYLEKKYSLKNKKVIFSVGRISESKGFQFLIDAMQIVIAKVPDALAVIAGSGSYKPVLEDLVRKKDLSNNVKLIGWIDEKSKAFLYKRSELVVFPSLQEPFGIVILEALAMHKPLVAFETPSSVEIIKKDTALLVPIGNAEELGRAIVRILTDSRLRDKLVANTNNCKVLPWKEIADQYVEVYNKFINESAKTLYLINQPPVHR